MKKVERLKQFITENNLEFNGGSGGDVNILALCGYACYIEASQEDVIYVANTNDTDTDDEIKRVFDYASTHGYSKFWETDKARKQYSF